MMNSLIDFQTIFLANVCEDWESALAPLSQFDLKLAIIRVGVVLDHMDESFLKCYHHLKWDLGL